MNRKTLVLLAVPYVLLQIVGFLGGERTGLIMVLAIFAISALRFRYYVRRWRGRIEKLRDVAPLALSSTLRSMGPEEQSAIRLLLGIHAPDQVRLASSEGELFSYRRSSTAVREYTYWASLACASIPLVLLALGKVADEQQPYFLAVGLGFALSVLYQLRIADRQSHTIRVTPFGVQEIAPPDDRVGILWKEIAFIRNRKWPRRIEIVARDGRRRIRVWSDLEGIVRFRELLVAYRRPPARRIEGRLVEETRTEDGWAMEILTSAYRPENATKGTALVVAPDGSRAGLFWFVGEGELEELYAPERQLWGVFTVWFPKPVFNAEDLAANFNIVLPALRARYEEFQLELSRAADARAAVQIQDDLPGFRVTRIRENIAEEFLGDRASDPSSVETGVELETLDRHWSERAAFVLASQPTWSVSFWTNSNTRTACTICGATISKTENVEHAVASNGARICPQCYQLYFLRENLGFIVAPAKDPDVSDAPVARPLHEGGFSAREIGRGLGRAVVVAILVGFAWIFLSTFSTDTPKGRVLGIIMAGITLIVAFGFAIPSRLGFAFRFFAASMGAGYLFMFYNEARKLSSSDDQPLTFKTPAIATGIILLMFGVPLLIYALHRRSKKQLRPARGELYRSKRNVAVRGLTTFRNPSSNRFRAVLPRGEIVSLEYDPPSLATSVYAMPRRYNALERMLVPAADRSSDAYGGYALVISLEQLAHDFERAKWHEAA